VVQADAKRTEEMPKVSVADCEAPSNGMRSASGMQNLWQRPPSSRVY